MAGLLLREALLSMDSTLRATELTLSEGVQSSYKIDRQMYPLEYTCSWCGKAPWKVTSGASIG